MISGEGLTIADVVKVARLGARVEVAPGAVRRMLAARRVVEEALSGGRVIYGVTTGFGNFATVVISPDQARELQLNLVRSHATGVGPPLARDAVRATMLLRANALARGNSGVRPEVVGRLVDMLNHGVTPVVPSKGSVGASGDLAPLAHLALACIGEGAAEYAGRMMPAREALSRCGLSPLTLEAKEGLGLLNGTPVMTGIAALACWDSRVLARTADVAGAVSVEALRGTVRAFDARIQDVRGHPGQALVAANLRTMLRDSRIMESHALCPKVQDAYSLRCMPQVHGAVRDALAHAERTVEVEMNSATDNPLVFPEDGEVLSGGNFHGEPVALAMDLLGIGVAELGSISERRTDRMLNPYTSGLPPFLTTRGGLHSGLMLLQYTAAALVSENKILASPASVDSIPTSAGQEDHVSMGTVAARKAADIVQNVARILACELICACQGVDFLSPLTPGVGVRAALTWVRRIVPEVEGDQVMSDYVEALSVELLGGGLVRAVEEACGPLG